MAQNHQEPGKTYAAICKKTGILSLYRRGMMFCRFFMFKKCVEAIEAEYPVKIVIHKEIPGDFYSDDETIQLVYELYDQRVDKGICCVFRYNNLLAKNVLPSYVCDYKKRVGLFQRSVDLV